MTAGCDEERGTDSERTRRSAGSGGGGADGCGCAGSCVNGAKLMGAGRVTPACCAVVADGPVSKRKPTLKYGCIGAVCAVAIP